MKVALVNPRSGEVRMQKIGWSWTIFLFSGLLGIPLFLRRLYGWGAVFAAIWVANMLLSFVAAPSEVAAGWQIIIVAVSGSLSIYTAIVGNRLTGVQLLDEGWTFAEPDGFTAQFAKQKWNLVSQLGPAVGVRIEPSFETSSARKEPTLD